MPSNGVLAFATSKRALALVALTLHLSLNATAVHLSRQGKGHAYRPSTAVVLIETGKIIAASLLAYFESRMSSRTAPGSSHWSIVAQAARAPGWTELGIPAACFIVQVRSSALRTR